MERVKKFIQKTHLNNTKVTPVVASLYFIGLQIYALHSIAAKPYGTNAERRFSVLYTIIGNIYLKWVYPHLKTVRINPFKVNINEQPSLDQIFTIIGILERGRRAYLKCKLQLCGYYMVNLKNQNLIVF